MCSIPRLATGDRLGIAESAPFPKTERFPVLTSLRFFAAAEVLIYHCGRDVLDTAPGPMRDFFSNGYEAVMFFFVLSGFVLTHAHRRPQEFDNWAFRKRYYLGRFARIYPVYAIGLAIAAPAFLYGGLIARSIEQPAFFAGLVLVPFLLQSWYPPAAMSWVGPAWSLSVEAAFYASLPAIIRRLTVRAVWLQMAICLVSLVAVEALRQWLGIQVKQQAQAKDVVHNFISYFPLFFFPLFMFGSALACAHMRSPLSARFARPLFYGALAIVIGLFCLRSRLPAWAFSNLVLVPLYGLIILSATTADGWLARFLSRKSLVLLGDSSYAIYLLHAPLFYWWGKLGLTGWDGPAAIASAALFCVIVVAASIVCYQIVEAPFVRWFRTPPTSVRLSREVCLAEERPGA